MPFLPQSSSIDIRLLGQVFANTVATYKFYWFLSILEIFNQTGRTTLTFQEIICRMIVKAWYPIHYFKLSFGLSDMLVAQCNEILNDYNFRIDVKQGELENELLTLYSTDPMMHAHILHFGKNVPHWFMSPWFPKCSESEIIDYSQRFANNCPYAIYKTGEKRIVLNPSWTGYFSENYGLLCDFCYWNLALFLQRRNPNVPDIPHKLVQPLERTSLTRQRKYWELIFEAHGPVPCIYTGKMLTKDSFDLDHFLPWSFVAHDLMWNLVPADGSVNSSKSNHLPALDKYLAAFATRQQTGLQIVSQLAPGSKLLEDFLQLGASITELTQMPAPEFMELYKKSITPLYQIAENMGFSRWSV